MAFSTSSFSTIFARDDFVPAEVPRAALIVSTILSMVAISLLVVFISQRVRSIPSSRWTKLPLTHYLVIAIYADSILFVVVTAILSHGWGINASQGVCSAAILLCLCCYMSTKLLYYFLMEKVYIIRGIKKPRHKSKLYLFNTIGVLTPFLIVVIFNFIFRINRFDNGTCIIGMEKQVLMPLIFYDLVVNIYLTTLFIIPLRHLYSYQHNPDSLLRTVAVRTFIGSIMTLISSIVNLTVLMVLQGEAAWICLMCCNSDILLSSIVLHWVTTKDNSSGSSNDPTSGQGRSEHPYRSNNGHSKSTYVDGSTNKTTVTTKISARPVAGNGSEEDLADMRADSAMRKVTSNNIPLRNIEVRTDYTVEVSRDERASGTSVEELRRETADKRSERSTEDLVYRP